MDPVCSGPKPSDGDAPSPPCETEQRPVVDTAAEQGLARLYRILIHNDDVTTMEFVVHVLLQVFKKDEREAVEIMLTAHQNGTALVAVMPLEVAELRIDQAHSMARTAKYPLTFTCEQE
jgi:ATP-dependent Clp protease adaptor protein ClpS